MVDDLDVLQAYYQEINKPIKIKDATCKQIDDYYQQATKLGIEDIHFLDDGSSLGYMRLFCEMYNRGLGKE